MKIDPRLIVFYKLKSKYLVKILKIKNGKRSDKENIQYMERRIEEINSIIK